ncbi:MFS transporter [Lysinibacillus yapensis]|uniref:MFS transporter n=1 Tax=Ureibacillus yapensis TaxID=2304605 RepID=A0A396SHA9_9BACL|nr:MFS transporter [Lysinibacillus yapensis]RHW38457.1 MFS transporter [Lysinibacillus yapensis]
MDRKRISKRKKNVPKTPSPSNSVKDSKSREEEERRAKRAPFWAFGCLGSMFLGMVAIFLYDTYLLDYMEETNWLTPQINLFFSMFIFFLVIGLLLFSGLFFKEGRKKVGTYIAALIGVGVLWLSSEAYTDGKEAIDDMEVYKNGNYATVTGIIEDYRLYRPKRGGSSYITSVTINGTDYDVEGYIGIDEAKQGVGKLKLKIHYLPKSKFAMIVEFYDENGEVTKVVDKRTLKALEQE